MKAEGIFADRTIEVSMHVIRVGAGTIFSTKAIFRATAFIINLMHNAMLLECLQRSVESCPVRVRKVLLKVGEAHGRSAV